MLKRLSAGAAGLLSGLAWAGYGAPATAGAAGGVPIPDPAKGWDFLWREVIIDISAIGIAFALLTAWFIWRYRRRPGNELGHSPRLAPGAAVAWVVLPTFIFLSDDLFIAANGWQLWNAYRQVPADRLEVEMESGMYSWDYTYPNGIKAQNDLRVPAGKPVMLRMHSRDTLHSHFIPDFRVKEDSMPGRVTYLWFYPKAPGKHLVTCAEYCGVMHSYMVGRVIVMPPAEFDAWYRQEGTRHESAKAAAADKPNSGKAG